MGAKIRGFLALGCALFLGACESMPHPLDCATGLVAWDNCPPGTAGYRERHPEPAMTDDEQCQSFGAKPGTDAYVQCRTTLTANGREIRSRSDAQRRTLMLEYWAVSPHPALPPPVTPSPVPASPTTNCTTTMFGTTAQTTCH